MLTGIQSSLDFLAASLPSGFWVGVALVVGFTFLWILICFLDSQFTGGWGGFAKLYPAPSRPSGNSYCAQNCRFAKASRGMKGARVIFADTGLYFYMTFFSRLGHPPFLLPWDGVKSIEKKYGFLGDYYQIHVKDAAGEIAANLPLKVEQDLSRHHTVKLMPEVQSQQAAATYTIRGIAFKFGGVLLLSLVAYWLGNGLRKDDLVMPTKHGDAHFHGLAAWLEAGAFLCFAILGAGFLIVPGYRGYRRGLLYTAWALFIIGIVVGIWRHGR